MLSSTIISRAWRTVGQRAYVLLSSATTKQQQQLSTLANQFHSVVYESPNKFVTSQVSLLHHSAFNSSPFRFRFSSSASPEPSEKDHGNAAENNESTKTNGESKVTDQTKESGVDTESQSTTTQSVKRRRHTKRTAFSDSDSDCESDLSKDDLVKLVSEKEELLNTKQEELKAMQEKVLRAYAEMENVTSRTKREAENSKKFAIQNLAKSLLDVADNLGRASSSVKDSLAKIDESKDATGAVSVIKTLLEGVEMTDKQLLEVFRKFGVEKFDPKDEPFDPHRHNAVFQVPDSSKPPGTVCHVLKSGYILYDRVIRPAEVGVTQEVEKDESANN